MVALSFSTNVSISLVTAEVSEIERTLPGVSDGDNPKHDSPGKHPLTPLYCKSRGLHGPSEKSAAIPGEGAGSSGAQL